MANTNYLTPGTVTTVAGAVTAFFEWLKSLKGGGGVYKRFFKGANLGFCVVNLDGEFLHVNTAFCELIGHREADLIGTKFMRLVVLEDRRKTIEAMNELREGAELKEFSNCYDRGDGSKITLIWWSVVFGKEIFAVTMEKPAT